MYNKTYVGKEGQCQFLFLLSRLLFLFLVLFSFTLMTSTENKAVKRPIYEESSQYRHWRFSAAQLWEIREASNRAAVERVKQNFQEEMVREQQQKILTAKTLISVHRISKLRTATVQRSLRICDT